MLFERKSQIKIGLSFISLFIGAFVSMSAFAAKESNLVGEELKRVWNAPNSQNTFFEHTLKTGCIGDSLTDCAVWTNNKAGDVSYNYGTEKDFGTIMMMVAVEIKNHGAKFCPVQIQASNTDQLRTCAWGWGWNCYGTEEAGSTTRYYFANGNTSPSNCVWLCKDGYYGSGCTSTTPRNCSSGTQISKSSYSNIRRVTKGTNIEDKLPMFYMNKTEFWEKPVNDAERFVAARSLVLGQNIEEYDQILAIKDWLPSGNGAFVSPVNVRARLYQVEKDKKNSKNCYDSFYSSTVFLEAAGKQTLVCKDGYKPNSNNTDCVLADPEMCAEKKANQTACSGFSGYDSKLHIKNVKIDQGCYEFYCAGGKAFQSETSRKCIECTGEPGRFGVVEETGVCVTCPIGTVFDGTEKRGDSFVPYCPTAKAYSPTVLEYGKNGSSGDSISNQCWTFTDLDLYKECVENGAAKAKAKLQQKRADADASRAAARRARR